MLEAAFPIEIKKLFRGAAVVNRVFSLRGTRFGDLIASLGLHELWAYHVITPLLRSASFLAHDYGTRGVSRSLLPLNCQWFLLDRAQEPIELPAFAYGFGRAIPNLHKFNEPMQKSIWSLYDWKEETRLSSNEKIWHRFYVEKPTGTPVICYFSGDSFDFSFPHGDILDVDVDAYQTLVKAARSQFKSYFGELLTYIDQRKATFRAFSPYLLSVRHEPAFMVMVSKGLQSLSEHGRQVYAS
jgi:hypothetical protein